MLAAPGASLQLVECHGRMQRVQLVTSLRQFGRGRLACAALSRPPESAAASASAAAGTAAGDGGRFPLSASAAYGSPLSSSSASRYLSLLATRHLRCQPTWRCRAAQQLHGAATAGAASVGGAARQTIQPGEVHVWWLDPTKVSSEQELAYCSQQLLTPEELRDCTASGDELVRRERILARALVRSVLAGYLAEGTHPRSLQFERNRHGKPRLAWPRAAPGEPRLRFSLTHTSNLIGLAVAAEGLVGLDVEGLERRTRGDPMRLAQRRFSQAEIADLLACPDDDARATYFLQLWTLKEAYVKAVGRGISAPPGLRGFSFRVGPAASCSIDGNSAAGSSSGESGSSGNLDLQPATPRQQPERRQAGDEQGAAAAGGAEPAAAAQQIDVWRRGASGSVSIADLGGSSNGSSSMGSGSINSTSVGSTSGSSIDFSSAAPEGRRWHFALLQPWPGHMAALCVERSRQQGEQQGPLQLRHFEASLGGGDARLLEPLLLAQGLYP